MSDGHWFVTRRVVKKAVHWDGTNVDEMADFAGDRAKVKAEGERKALVIETLEGTMIGEPGDWIIRGVNGEFYPCKPDIFAKTYEPFEKVTAGEPSSAPPAIHWENVGYELGRKIYAYQCEHKGDFPHHVELGEMAKLAVKVSRGAAQEVSPASTKTIASASIGLETIGSVQEIRPRPDDPSCGVCGAQMVVKEWKCLSCQATTGVERGGNYERI